MSISPLPPGESRDTAVTLARIEVKLDAALTTDRDHEKRIRALEARNWPRASLNLWIAGCAAVAAAATVIEGILIR